MSRALILYKNSLKASLHRLRHDLIREIVVAICSLVIFSLFFYVFNDFLNVEVKQMSTAMRDAFGRWLAGAGCLVAAGFAGRKIRAERIDPRSFVSSAKFLGESPTELSKLWKLRVMTTCLTFYIPALFITHRYLYTFNPKTFGMAFAALVLITAITSLMSKGNQFDSSSSSNSKKTMIAMGNIPPIKALVNWRMQLILKRNRLTQVCIFISLTFSSLVLLSALKNAPVFVAILAAFMGGVLLAAALAFQLSEDLNYSWVEKNLGVSHELYLQALSKVALKLGFAVGIISGMAWFLPFFIKTQSVDAALIQTSLKIMLMTFTPVWLLPHLAFQIDARKPAVQIIAVLLISLFICTAIFVHWLALLLLPILSYYAGQSQQGHFYRA